MDKRTWNNYDDAIIALKAELERQKKDPLKTEPYELSRFQATEICEMSPSVFGREVPMSSLFRAYYGSPRYEGKSSYYQIQSLIDHFGRMKSREANVALLHEFYEKGEDGFNANEEYQGEAKDVFADGTYLPIGDFNEQMF